MSLRHGIIARLKAIAATLDPRFTSEHSDDVEFQLGRDYLSCREIYATTMYEVLALQRIRPDHRDRIVIAC